MARRKEVKAAELERPPLEVDWPADEADAEALWQAVLTIQDAAAAERARTIHTDVKMRIPTRHRFGVAFPSDLHIGGMGTDHRAIRRDIALIAACPRLKAFLGGDGVDNYVLAKLAHAARDGHAIAPSLQWLLLRDVVRQLLETDSVLAVGDGNHNAWTRRAASLDGTLAALHGLKVLFTGEGGYLRLTVGEIEYVIYRKHRPGMSSRYNPTHAARQALRFGTELADVVVIEHQHEPSVETGRQFGQKRVFIRTGTYKLNDSHAAEFGFNHQAASVPVVVFDPHERRMTAFDELEPAIEYLNGSP